MTSIKRVTWILVGCVFVVGCRREAPPSFTPGPEVISLMDDLDEDAEQEEIDLYRDLQKQIAAELQRLTGTPDKLIVLGTEENTDQLKLGYSLYTNYCVQCHGVNGDGNGAVAEHLNPKPRNYTLGIFKFTSTPYGGKPRRADLARTIRQGVTGTSMPSFDRFSAAQIEAVVEYVLALTYRGQMERELAAYAYDEEEMPDEESLQATIEDILGPWEDSSSEIVMPVSLMPPLTEESIRKGHEIFLNRACNKCHGKYGRGGSMGNVEVGNDAWGYKAAAADLSSGMFHGGDRPIDIYRRIYSGINGTSMPAFANMFKDDPDQIWYLVHFIKATGDRRRQGMQPLSAADLPTQNGPAASAEETEADETEAADSETEETDESESEEIETDDAEDTDTEDAATEDATPEDDSEEQELQPAA